MFIDCLFKKKLFLSILFQECWQDVELGGGVADLTSGEPLHTSLALPNW